MKNEIIYLMVRVFVSSNHKNISDTVHELETQAAFSIIDTENVKVLETEILLTRVRNIKRINHGAQS